MNWFSHETRAHNNPKMVKLLAAHGAAGVGLFWIVVECIGERWEDCEGRLHPSYDADYLSGLVRIDSGLVRTMLDTMVRCGLLAFVDHDGQADLYCESLGDHLGEGAKKAVRRKKAKLLSGQTPDMSGAEADMSVQTPAIRQDKRREEGEVPNKSSNTHTLADKNVGLFAGDEIEAEEQPGGPPPILTGRMAKDFDWLWERLPKEMLEMGKKAEAQRSFKKLRIDNDLTQVIEMKIGMQDEDKRRKEAAKEFVPRWCSLSTYLNQRRWE